MASAPLRTKPTQAFWAAVGLIILLSAVPRVMSYGFSLPYVDHPDEPNYYHGGQLMRGIPSDDPAYYRGMPPGYLWLQAGVQTLLNPFGITELSDVIHTMRGIAVIANLVTLLVIAITAREALPGWSGVIAGLLAGAAWGLAPLVVENGVYALPDPFVYLLTSVALWLAVRAVKMPNRAAPWLLTSTLTALTAVIVKYPALPALLPGLIATAWVTIRQRRHGLSVLAAQLLITALVGLWLVYGYGIVIQREGVTIRDSGIANMLDLPRVLNNMRYAALPIAEPGVWIVLAAGLIAMSYSWRRCSSVLPVLLPMCVSLFIAVPWLTASFAIIDSNSIRYVLPATTAVCVCFGVCAAYIAQEMPLRRPYAHVLVAASISTLIFVPMWNGSYVLALEHARPDARVALHHWFDENLETGNVIVDAANHKTFNPGFGGLRLSHGDWASWFQPDNLLELSPAQWHARGFDYALLPYSDWQAMEATAEGQAYLSQMLYLRAFADPRYRGPQTVVFRLTPIEIERRARFGDAIQFLGYDRSPEHEADNMLSYRFYWSAAHTPAGNYSLFLHLVAAATRDMLAQADGAPAQRPTLTWDAADEVLISSAFTVQIPADAPPAEYQVLLGLYDYVTGERLPVTGEGAQGDALMLATVQLQ